MTFYASKRYAYFEIVNPDSLCASWANADAEFFFDATATCIITGIGEYQYANAIRLDFLIKEPEKPCVQHVLRAEWENKTGIFYYDAEDFTEGTSKKINKLKAKKKYYFRVRAYKTEKGKTAYGTWSKKKAVKVKG